MQGNDRSISLRFRNRERRGVIFVQPILYNSCDNYFSPLFIGQKQWKENKKTCELSIVVFFLKKNYQNCKNNFEMFKKNNLGCSDTTI